MRAEVSCGDMSWEDLHSHNFFRCLSETVDKADVLLQSIHQTGGLHDASGTKLPHEHERFGELRHGLILERVLKATTIFKQMQFKLPPQGTRKLFKPSKNGKDNTAFYWQSGCTRRR